LLRYLINAKIKTFEIGRDAITGRFIPIHEARKHSNTAVVETVKVVRAQKGKCKK
jgi:hypothetical protein